MICRVELWLFWLRLFWLRLRLFWLRLRLFWLRLRLFWPRLRLFWPRLRLFWFLDVWGFGELLWFLVQLLGLILLLGLLRAGRRRRDGVRNQRLWLNGLPVLLALCFQRLQTLLHQLLQSLLLFLQTVALLAQAASLLALQPTLLAPKLTLCVTWTVLPLVPSVLEAPGP